MSSARIVSVFGATGLQGSAVVDALLKDGSFVPRAISRDPDSEASLKLKARGVEVVKGDSLNKASLVSALRGSEAVFAVTASTFKPGEDELTQGKNMVDAAKEVGVKFFIWTGLPSLKTLSGGKYQNATHFEEKVAVQEYLQSSGLTHATLLLPAFLENLWKFHAVTKTDTGYNIAVNLPEAKSTAVAWVSHDVPAAALVLLKNYTDPSKGINGKAYPVVTAYTSYGELTARIAKVLNTEVTYTQAPPVGMPPIDELFAFLAEDDFYPDTPIPNPELLALGMKFGTLEDFLKVEIKARYGQ